MKVKHPLAMLPTSSLAPSSLSTSLLATALVSTSLLCASGTALADDAAMLKCRTLPAGAARLACYDAIPVGAHAVAAAVPAATAPAVAAPSPTPEQSFGMEQVKKPAAAPDAPPKFIESTIEGTFSGWGPNSRIKLANGQVWRIADQSSADLLPAVNQKVRIVRNVIGTMFLEIPGTNNSPKVRRVQ